MKKDARREKWWNKECRIRKKELKRFLRKVKKKLKTCCKNIELKEDKSNFM